MAESDPRPSEDHVRRTRKLAVILAPALTEVCRRHGYSLTFHGSFERDLDLVACPWRAGATEPASLARDVYAACEAVLGSVTGPAGWTEREAFLPPEGSLPNPTRRAHGRLAWVIQCGGPYLDFSVFPPRDDLEVKP